LIDGTISITASLGVAVFYGDDIDLDELIRRSRKPCMKQKAKGKIAQQYIFKRAVMFKLCFERGIVTLKFVFSNISGQRLFLYGLNMKLYKFLLPLLIIAIPAAAIKADEWFDPTTYEKKVQAEFSAAELLPIGDFSDLYKIGFGGMFDLSYVAQRQQNYRFSLRIGYFYLIAEEETDDGYKTGISEGFIIPFLLNYEYRMSVFFYKRVKIAPSLAFGPSINRAVYDDRSGTIEDGVPTGHAALKDKSVMSIELVLDSDVNLYQKAVSRVIPPVMTVQLQISTETATWTC
jgi:hypothetical protein